jgi:hypothetical protein
MSFSFNKSSLLASVEILNDKHFNKYKDLNYIESQKTTLDIKNGKKIIDTIGVKLIQKYNKTKTSKDNKYILREILTAYIKKTKPGFIFRITGGRQFFLGYVTENFEQLLREAGLLDKIDFSPEGIKIRIWWDDLSEFVRKLDKSNKLDLGRKGEEKTIKFEEKKLKKLKINKKPSWDGFENNLLGYDVQSWKTNSKKIFIEVKASSYSNGTFFLTRNEWNFSLSVKDDFFIHLWIQDENNPRIISFQELHSKNYRIEDSSNSEWTNIKIVPVKIN